MKEESPLPTSIARSRVDAGRQSESTAGLLTRLINEVSTLFRQELQLAKTEISEAVSEGKTALISMATGGAVLFAGILVLLQAAVFALAHIVSDWLAALIVGAVVAVIGFVMIQRGKKNLTPAALKPVRTQESLRKDKEMVERRIP